MKHKLFVILFLVMMATQCSKDNSGSEKKEGFNNYLATLDVTETPFLYNTKDGLKGGTENYDSALFAPYKYAWSVRPYGKLASSDSTVTTIEVVAGDIVVPVLMTYDTYGTKLDSLSPITKSREDNQYGSYEYLTITSDKVIVIDSTKAVEVNGEGNIIEGIWKLSVDTTIYEIDNLGKIKKVKG